MKRSYAIIGTGAVGIYYGVRLQWTGLELHYLLNSSYEAVLKDGVSLQAPGITLGCPEVNAYRDVKAMPACDVVIVALKTTQNHLLPELLPPLLKKNSVIIMLQNGFGNEEYARTIAPSHSILAGLTTIGARVIAPGKTFLNHMGFLRLAPFQKAPDFNENMAEILNDLKKAVLETEMSPDYFLARWQKLSWNMIFNGLSVIHQCSADVIAREHLPEVKGLFAEIENIIAAYDRAFSPEHFDQILKTTLEGVGYKPSMLIDYENQRPMEIEYLYGNPIKAAKNKGVDCPLLMQVYSQLQRNQ